MKKKELKERIAFLLEDRARCMRGSVEQCNKIYMQTKHIEQQDFEINMLKDMFYMLHPMEQAILWNSLLDARQFNSEQAVKYSSLFRDWKSQFGDDQYEFLRETVWRHYKQFGHSITRRPEPKDTDSSDDQGT